MKTYDVDEMANKIKDYFRKTGTRLDEAVYDKEQHAFIDYTMSCDVYEVVGTAKAILAEMIFHNTTDENRLKVYSEYLAIYDIYQSVKTSGVLYR